MPYTLEESERLAWVTGNPAAPLYALALDGEDEKISEAQWEAGQARDEARIERNNAEALRCDVDKITGDYARLRDRANRARDLLAL